MNRLHDCSIGDMTVFLAATVLAAKNIAENVKKQ